MVGSTSARTTGSSALPPFWAPELAADFSKFCEETKPADEVNDDSNCSILSTASTQFHQDIGGPPMMSTDSSADECDARACLRDETAYLEHMLRSFFAIYAPGHIDEAKPLTASYVDRLAAMNEELNDEYIYAVITRDAGSCLRDETAYLEHILLSFFAIYAPEHIDEAKSLAASYVDHLAAVHEEMNDEMRADLLTPTFLQSLSLSQNECDNEMCHVICGEAGREAGIFEGHPQVYPKPTAKAFLPGQTVSASITEPEHMDASADVDPRLSRRARLPVRSCLGQSDLGECKVNAEA